MNTLRKLTIPLALLTLGAGSLAQSINLDINIAAGEGAGVPASTYAGAAGQPGTWNAVTSSTPSVSALLGLDGLSSGVTLIRTTASSSYIAVPNPGSTGAYAALMDDVQRVPAGSTITYTFGNLDAGNYAVYTYATFPTGMGQRVTVAGSSSNHSTQLLWGDFFGPLAPNDFDFPNTHAIHLRTVAEGGSISVTIDGQNNPSHLAGIQIKKITTGRFRLYANDNPPASGLKTGGSWTDANPDLEECFNIAALAGPGIDIWAAEGTYKPNLRSDSRSMNFTFTDDVHLYGGFSGTETSLSQRPAPGTLVSTLSGEIGTAAVTDNAYNVVTVSLADDVVLDNLVITGGFADGNIIDQDKGAGLLAVGGSGVVRHCTFIDHISTAEAPVFIRSSVAEFRFEHCDFIENLNLNADGGAVMVRDNAEAGFINCRFLRNAASAGDGGAVSAVFAQVAFTNCLLSGNATGSLSSRGGAIFATGADAGITMRNCTVGYNFTNGTCGGVTTAGLASLNVGNSVFWGNIDGSGSGTTADNFIAALPADNNPPFTVIEGGGGTINVSNPGFTDANGADGIFGTLDDNYNLLITSPLIDAGKNFLLPLDTIDLDNDGTTFEFTPFDLAGRARLIDISTVPNTGEGTPTVDVGAYETPVPPCVGDLNNDGQRNTADLVIFLGDFGSAGPGSASDLNNDNAVNTADLVIFLGVFGVPCL